MNNNHHPVQFISSRHNTESQPFYVEKEGVGLEEIKIFVEYMMFQRTRDVRSPHVDIHGFTTYTSEFQYVPLSDGEKIPDILFTTKSDLVPEEDPDCGHIICRTHASGPDANGRHRSPLHNYKVVCEGYYNSGLKEGNLVYLHRFACKLNKMFVNNFEVRTWTDETQRYFEFKNPNRDHPNHCYEDELLND